MFPRHLRSLGAAALAFVLAAPLLAADAPGIPAAAASTDVATSPIGPAPLRQVAAETRYWSRLGALLGSGDRRKLQEAWIRFKVQSAFYRDDPLLDPFYDRTRSTVRDGYVKLYREMMRREFVNDMIDQNLRDAWSGKLRPLGSRWTLSVDPRLAVGRHGYVGADFSLAQTPIAGLRDFSLQVSKGYMDHELSMALRYQHGPRFFQLEQDTGDPATGRRVALSVVLRF